MMELRGGGMAASRNRGGCICGIPRDQERGWAWIIDWVAEGKLANYVSG